MANDGACEAAVATIAVPVGGHPDAGWQANALRPARSAAPVLAAAVTRWHCTQVAVLRGETPLGEPSGPAPAGALEP